MGGWKLVAVAIVGETLLQRSEVLAADGVALSQLRGKVEAPGLTGQDAV